MRKFFISISMLLTSLLPAYIVETAHFCEIENYLLPGTLILLDIDDTLLIPVQMLGCDEWFLSRLADYQRQGYSKSAGLEKSLAEWEAIRHLTKMEIVEPETEKIVASLQNQGGVVMGLTTQGLGLANRTKLQLQDNGIDLSLTAPCNLDYYFCVNGHGVLFRSGILFTSGTHKGEALFGLLDDLNYTPKRIVFINDKATHLGEIEKTAQERGVEFIGLRYGYSDSRKSAFRNEIASYQFSHSTFTHILSDAEAREALER